MLIRERYKCQLRRGPTVCFEGKPVINIRRPDVLGQKWTVRRLASSPPMTSIAAIAGTNRERGDQSTRRSQAC